MMKIPPFKITPLILRKSQEISRDLGIIAGQKLTEVSFQLRRQTTLKRIHASLAIEGNTLNLDQVTALLDGKRVVGPLKDIIEVQNALCLYENINSYNPLEINNLLQAHAILMNDLLEDHGKWRSRGVGIFKAGEVSHVAPPAKRIPILMQDLFDFIRQDSEISWLLKACIFHYEFEFIHPFSDGNGRMGRLWQQLLLMKEDPIFEFIPIEVLIRDYQVQYYQALEESDQRGESTPFIEFSLDLIQKALATHLQTVRPLTKSLGKEYRARLDYARAHIQKKWFSRKDYCKVHNDISQATASRDLLRGVQEGIVQRQGDKNQVIYCFLDEANFPEHML